MGEGGRGRVIWLLYLTMKLWCVCVSFGENLGGYLQLFPVSEVC